MKKVVVVVNTYKDEARSLAETVCAFLASRGVSSTSVDFGTADVTPDFSPYEAAITVGGDGTVLFAARACLQHNVPIFPINLGEFGFIAGIQKENWERALDSFLQNGVHLVGRSMLSVTVLRENKPIFAANALNDVVISADKAARIVSLDVSYNDYPFGLFKADGIIVATATGSTAYSAAAGGPIVDPGLDVFVLSPICPFSLSNRPLVLPMTGALTVNVLPSRGATISATADGQVSFSLKTNDTVLIQKSAQKVLLADCCEATFYQALRSKLHWSGGPVA